MTIPLFRYVFDNLVTEGIIKIMIKNNLSKLMGEKRIRISEMQRLTGLSESTIRRVYYDTTKNISYETINKLCWALECNTQDLLEYIPD